LTRCILMSDPYERCYLIRDLFGFMREVHARSESWQGEQDIRDALIDAAKAANDQAHGVLAKEFVRLLNKKKVKELPGWYCHDLRAIVMALLANPNCDESNASSLAELYDQINEATH